MDALVPESTVKFMKAYPSCIYSSLIPHAAAAAAKSLQSCPTLVRPHRRQLTRLPRPWDSPVKSTGVGCHVFLQGGMRPASLLSPMLAGGFFTTGATWKAKNHILLTYVC